MDLGQFQEKIIREKFGIDAEKFGKIYSFVDFGNVDYWFDKDIKDGDGNILLPDQKLVIDLEKLAHFSNAFSSDSGFYFGIDIQKNKSGGFISRARQVFGKYNVFTKPIQFIRHYLNDTELQTNTRSLNYDLTGQYIYIPKCNFDVEICVDAIRLMGDYDTFCLFSSDSDFIGLVRYLKKNGKKFILIKGGYVQHKLDQAADLRISAQDIKQYITFIKQKSSR